MPEKKATAKKTTKKTTMKTAATTTTKKATTMTTAAKPPAAPTGREQPASPSVAAIERTAPEADAPGACPRCGTTKFGPEQRTRVEGNRTVRYTILVCERGHTFARPVSSAR